MRTKMILLGLLLATAVTGAVERREDAYQSIIDRNPFGLKDPPPLTKEAPVEKKPEEKKTEFYLTGISTMGYPKRPKKAYLINKDQTKKEYADKFFNMVIGDKAGDLALQDIDEKNRRVKIAYRGEEMWLNMKDNGVPAPAGPVPVVAGAPGLVGHPGPMGQPGAPPVQTPGGPVQNAPPMPVSNPNRRIPRTQMGVPMGGAVAPAPASVEGPQTDAAILEQIIRMQNPGTFDNPGAGNNVPVNNPNIQPNPPNPNIPNPGNVPTTHPRVQIPPPPQLPF